MSSTFRSVRGVQYICEFVLESSVELKHLLVGTDPVNIDFIEVS